MSEKTDYVEVSVRLPKPMYQFYKGLTTFLKEESLESFLTNIIAQEVDHLLDDTTTLDPIIKRYGIQKWVKRNE